MSLHEPVSPVGVVLTIHLNQFSPHTQMSANPIHKPVISFYHDERRIAFSVTEKNRFFTGICSAGMYLITMVRSVIVPFLLSS